jgi:dipeptidyl aminopeptidase/acylaminoacyl peptidase
VFFAQRIGFLYRQEQDESLVRAIRLKDGRLRTIAACAGLQQFLEPELSPDGRKVAIAYDADNPIFDFLLSVGVADASPSADTAAKPIVRLTREAKLLRQRWSPDGRRIYALRLYGIYRQVYAIDPKSGALTQITHEPLAIEDYAISPDGRQLVWFGQDAHARRVLRIGRTDGTGARDLSVFEPAPEDMALSEVREVEWAVPDYPVPLRGLLIMPLHYAPGTRYPVIADIHGGGAGASGELAGALFVNTPLEWQLWAAKGYMVFVPELRSSTHRFRALVSKEGWADEFFPAGVFMTGRVTTIYGGTPVETPERYMRNSALFHARGATTPTLFLMGGRDHGSVDQLQTVHWLYNALRTQGVETQYVTYPDEGHGFERAANRRDALERTMIWIDGHAKSTASGQAPALPASSRR